MPFDLRRIVPQRVKPQRPDPWSWARERVAAEGVQTDAVTFTAPPGEDPAKNLRRAAARETGPERAQLLAQARVAEAQAAEARAMRRAELEALLNEEEKQR